MKKLLSLAAVLALCLGMIGCGKASSSSAAPAEPKDYGQILHDARTDEYNEAYMIITPGETADTFAAIDGMSADYDKDQLNNFSQMILDLMGLKTEDMDAYAVSGSMMNIKSYGVAIVKPAEGKTDTVKAALEAFVEGQKLAQEHYLPDQYEVAKAATVTVADSGEVVLVCCEGSEDVSASIKSALAA